MDGFPQWTVGGSGVSATVFPPKQLGHGFRTHSTPVGLYRSSRFDWLSIVGSIRVPTPEGGSVVLCGSAQPPPHDPYAPNYGVGLASEFGCGLHGTFCPPTDLGESDLTRSKQSRTKKTRPASTYITNGVFGYGDAGPGGTFLKLGVGKLQRPMNAADGTAGYNLSYPYKLVEQPQSQVRLLNCSRVHRGPELSLCASYGRWSAVEMQSTVRHRNWGFRIRRRIRPCGEPDGKQGAGALCVDVRLVNLGEYALTTPYMVANLFNVQGAPSVGPGYSVSFGLQGAQRYKDVPDSRPIEAVAVLQLREDGKPSDIMFARELPEHQRAMASFRAPDPEWNGGFTIAMPADAGRSVVVTHSMHVEQVSESQRKYISDPIPTHSWYGFNVHATKRSVAPRPYSLLTLPKDTSLQWTHRYDFSWRYDF